MKLIIHDKSNYNRDFVYNYLPKLIRQYALDSLEKTRTKYIDESYNINSTEIIDIALSKLKITEDLTDYTLEINKNLRWKSLNIDKLINLITYGNRSIKGYNILYKIFNLVANNLDIIYEEWLNGY